MSKQEFLQAIMKKDSETIKSIITKELVTDIEPGDSSPLDNAIAYGNSLDIIELLISYGADVNLANHLGYTPLHEAAYRLNLDAIKLLLQHKANLNPESELGHDTPLSWAIFKHCNYDGSPSSQNQREVVKTLWDAGARMSPNGTNANAIDPSTGLRLISPAIKNCLNEVLGKEISNDAIVGLEDDNLSAIGALNNNVLTDI